MRLKLDIEIPNWTKWLAGGIGIGAVLGVGAVVLAQAASVPNTFADGDTLSAAKMNANLRALQEAVNQAGIRIANGHSIRTGAIYCGTTKAGLQGGGIAGYGSAKSLCEETCSSPTAYAARIPYPTTGGPNLWAADCNGWTITDANYVGPDWSANGLTFKSCDESLRIHCCD